MNLRPVLATIDRIRTRQLPPLVARTLTESIAHRDQSSSPRAPSSSSRIRYSLATLVQAAVHRLATRRPRPAANVGKTVTITIEDTVFRALHNDIELSVHPPESTEPITKYQR